jgi:hypothetical protein
MYTSSVQVCEPVSITYYLLNNRLAPSTGPERESTRSRRITSTGGAAAELEDGSMERRQAITSANY